MLKALGKLGILIINVPEDTRDLASAGKEVLRIPSPEGYVVIPHDYQVKFSFFRGTLLEPIFKHLPMQLREHLANIDVTLYDTKLGQKFMELLGMPDEVVMRTSRMDNIKGGVVKAFKLEGKPIICTVGRSMMRIPVMSIYAFSALEIYSIYKAFAKAKSFRDKTVNGSKQIVKSIVNVTMALAAGAVLGAICARKGSVGSLAGLGIGTYAGTKLGSYINTEIDKI